MMIEKFDKIYDEEYSIRDGTEIKKNRKEKIIVVEIDKYNHDIGELREKFNELIDEFFGYNYFYDCPCCSGEKYIRKDSAIHFLEMNSHCYTTKESYNLHKTKIMEWEKEVKEFESKKND